MVRFDPLQKWAPRRRNAAIGDYQTPSRVVVAVSATDVWPRRRFVLWRVCWQGCEARAQETSVGARTIEELWADNPT